MTPEGKVAAALKAEAIKRGLYIRKLRFEGRVGAPDYIILASGKAFFIETKAPGQKPRPSQSQEFSIINRHGFVVRIVDSVEAAAEAVADIERESKT